MLRKLATLALAALIAGAAAPNPAPKAAKPTAKPAAAPLAHTGPADMRDPAALIAILSSLGAKAEVARRDGDAVFLAVTSPAAEFSAQFAGCNPQGKACQAVLFDRPGGGAPSLSQLNAFNQTSVMCRLYQDKGGRAHVLYSALLFAGEGRPEMLMHINAWRGCIGDFEAFLKDPTGFLAGAA